MQTWIPLHLNRSIVCRVVVLFGLLVALSSVAHAATGFITVTQTTPGYVTAALTTDSLIGNPFNFQVTTSPSGHEIQIVTGFGDTGLPVAPRVVQLGPLTTDGNYTVLWIEVIADDNGPPVGEQYAVSFQLKGGLLVVENAVAAIPTLGNTALIVLLLLVATLAFWRLRGATP